jgi:hypothetical protein
MIVLAVVADRRVGASVGNALLIERSALVTAGGFDGVRWGYPPIPTLVAGIVDDPLALSIVGCLLGGAAGFVVIQRMYARGLPAWLQVLIVASIGLMPSAWYVFTQDSDGMMGLALLVIALDGFERFAMEAETIGGFVTGLALGAAVLCDPSAIVYAIALAAAAPLAAAARYRGEPGVTAATVLVFGFPAAAALTSWAYIEWRFTGGAFHTLGVDRDLLSFDGGLWASLRREWRQRNRILLHTPLFVSVGIVMALRRPLSMVAAYVLPLFLLLMARLVGLAYPQMLGVVLLATVAAMTVPERLGQGDQVLIAVGAVVQFTVCLVWLPSAEIVEPWLDRLL